MEQKVATLLSFTNYVPFSSVFSFFRSSNECSEMEQKVASILSFVKMNPLHLSLTISDIQFIFDRSPFNFYFYAHLICSSYYYFYTVVMFMNFNGFENVIFL